MTVERRILRGNGTFRIVWVLINDEGKVVKISRTPIDIAQYM